MPISRRIKTLVSHFRPLEVDAVLVTGPTDIFYLTGYDSHDAWLLVAANEAFYITDARYTEEVKKTVLGVTVVRFEKTIYEGLVRSCQKARVHCLGVDERSLTVHQYKRIKSLCGNKIRLNPSDGCVAALRAVKDKGELELIQKSLELDLKAYSTVKAWLKPGVSETDILSKLAAFVRRNKAGFAFDPIIASGPNSAYPHARVTGRLLRSNEPVLIDLGMDLNGYKSDLTRIFFLGTMPTSFKDVLSKVRDAQQQAIKVIRPGVAARDVDAAARNYLKKYGLADHFSHSLGHGVGLDVHEDPRISSNSDAVLEENMVCTIEPGVYFPGKYGIRLEEMAVVTKKGCEVISVHHDQ